eukprot:COSAG01_NODE_1803_length_9197_cov_11.062321_6_plen_103_part_00
MLQPAEHYSAEIAPRSGTAAPIIRKRFAGDLERVGAACLGLGLLPLAAAVGTLHKATRSGGTLERLWASRHPAEGGGGTGGDDAGGCRACVISRAAKVYLDR